MTTWYRGSDYRANTVHAAGCHNCNGARRWELVNGWSDETVIDHVAKIPWLRICSLCGKRLGLTGDHPALAAPMDRRRRSSA